jgi:hypothetical protein
MVDPFAEMVIGEENPDEAELQIIYKTFRLDQSPVISLPVAEPVKSPDLEHFHVSPLQVALAATTLSNHGTIPTPQITTAVNTPNQGWVLLSAEEMPVEVVQPSVADEAANSLRVSGKNFWSYGTRENEKDNYATWFIAGTLPDWQGSPMVVVVLLEGNNLYRARIIGEAVLSRAINP